MKASLKEIKILINNRTFIIDDLEKEDPMTPCIDFYKGNIQSGASPEKLKLIIVVRGDFQNKDMIGDTWYPTAAMRALKYFLADASKNKARVHQLYFIGALL